MDSTGSPDNTAAGDESLSPSVWSRAYLKLGGLLVRRTSLWRDIQRFASWLESDAAASAKETHQRTILIEPDPDRGGAAVRIGRSKHRDTLSDYQLLWDFLLSLEIKCIEFDCRLEANQVADIMTLLYCYRRKLGRRRPDKTGGGMAGLLLGPGGLHMSCASVSVKGEKLTITYTYCTLAFSRLMRWFERKNRNFHDHRALFHTAPRYAVLVWIIAISPSIVYTSMRGDWLQFTISAFAAFLLAGLVYAFFMVAGSVEYDNEEKDYQLTRAYREIKTYADQIKTDLNRAQVIQRKFLPDLANGRLSEHVNWAFNFDPVEEVGGDYYDVQHLDDDRIAILFSDVSGHGMAAAFVTGILKTTFASWTDSRMELAEFVGVLNSTLCSLIPIGNFAAVFVGIYDCSTGELHYVNAGHHPLPWRMPAGDDSPISSISGGRALLMGVEQDIEIKPSRLTLRPGDIVLFASDGVVENQNSDGEIYGTERFGAFLQAQRGESVQGLVESIINEWRTYSRGAKQTDDRTVLALQIKDGTNRPSIADGQTDRSNSSG
ncbi:MAG: PP2C family protein-serine/threonine phosphatase [Planctomycetota bacterium]